MGADRAAQPLHFRLSPSFSLSDLSLQGLVALKLFFFWAPRFFVFLTFQSLVAAGSRAQRDVGQP